MEQTTKFDSNNAFVQVRNSIKGLMNFDGEDNQDDVIYTANRLNSVLRMVHDNYQSWNYEALREFVLSKNDPLKNINVKSDKFNHTVRKIQQDMIIQFS
ncbi:MAG: hypothetical protein LUQ11_16145 [Methylococcaceae bacterium]|nr:hypothetical protein [Methylococcaceae bacterium]